MSRGRVDLGVDWFLPGHKRRFATTTQASSHLILALAADGATWAQVHDAIAYDAEARAVAAAFVKAGHGAAAAAAMLTTAG